MVHCVHLYFIQEFPGKMDFFFFSQSGVAKPISDSST